MACDDLYRLVRKCAKSAGVAEAKRISNADETDQPYYPAIIEASCKVSECFVHIVRAEGSKDMCKRMCVEIY